MKSHLLPLMLFAALLAVSCSGDAPPGGSAGTGGSLTRTGQPTAGRPAGPTLEPGVRIPSDAQYTIYCATFTGSDHARRAKEIKAGLEQLPAIKGMRDWFIISQTSQSVLNYGFYRDVNDPKNKEDAERARADRHRIASLINRESADSLFPMCSLMPLDSSEPVAPPEWDLRNAKGFWSLQIAAFMQTPERKQAAVESVKAARAQGIEAYYYHGPVISSVCVGAWPREAVREQEASGDRAIDPSKSVMVVGSNIKLPDNFRAPDGTKVMQPRVEIADPTLLARISQFPYHEVNGARATGRKVRLPNGQEQVVYSPPFLVPIPQKEGYTSDRNAPIYDPGALPDTPQPARGPTGGRLRGIGD